MMTRATILKLFFLNVLPVTIFNTKGGLEILQDVKIHPAFRGLNTKEESYQVYC